MMITIFILCWLLCGALALILGSWADARRNLPHHFHPAQILLLFIGPFTLMVLLYIIVKDWDN
jgi:hypothetical protein